MMAENYKILYEQMKKMVEKYQDDIVPGLRRDIDRLEAERQWISVEDRLPKETEEVLWFDGGRMEIGCVFRSCGVTFVSTCQDIFPIDEYTHWMPLPAPPKEN